MIVNCEAWHNRPEAIEKMKLPLNHYLSIKRLGLLASLARPILEIDTPHHENLHCNNLSLVLKVQYISLSVTLLTTTKWTLAVMS